ncbi:MAG: exodeoxyribonuclease VII large subunit [Bacteroidota bacterium]
MTDKQIFTLQQVASSIRKTIEHRYAQSYWVKAEMHKLNRFPSGHAFPELVQKEGDKIIAQLGGTIWKQQLDRINQRFISVVKEPLKDGLNLLLLVKINFSETYGLSLQILDIDPSFSLGELQKQRDETLKKLSELGILNKNQLLEFPLIPKRIAVISADSSKGLSDFMEVLETNEPGYKFFTYLFPAYLQGDAAVDSIIGTLKKIKSIQQHFDLVVIVRGGGAEVSMTCYNHFELCETIAEFPLPILTGIGHSTNLTVAEMVSFRNAITPTKLAEFLIQTYREFDQQIKDLQTQLFSISKNNLQTSRNEFDALIRLFKTISISSLEQNASILMNEQNKLDRTVQYRIDKHRTTLNQIRLNFGYVAKNNLNRNESKLTEAKNILEQKLLNLFERSKNELRIRENKVEMLDPMHVLKRGFSITTLGGQTIKKNNFPKKGDLIQTTTAFGKIDSKVEGD